MTEVEFSLPLEYPAIYQILHFAIYCYVATITIKPGEKAGKDWSKNMENSVHDFSDFMSYQQSISVSKTL